MKKRGDTEAPPLYRLCGKTFFVASLVSSDFALRLGQKALRPSQFFFPLVPPCRHASVSLGDQVGLGLLDFHRFGFGLLPQGSLMPTTGKGELGQLRFQPQLADGVRLVVRVKSAVAVVADHVDDRPQPTFAPRPVRVDVERAAPRPGVPSSSDDRPLASPRLAHRVSVELAGGKDAFFGGQDGPRPAPQVVHSLIPQRMVSPSATKRIRHSNSPTVSKNQRTHASEPAPALYQIVKGNSNSCPQVKHYSGMVLLASFLDRTSPSAAKNIFYLGLGQVKERGQFQPGFWRIA